MTRTGWSIVAALVLVVLSAGLALTRHLLLGPDIDGPRSDHAWKVNLVVTGKLAPGETSLRTTVPLDFRRQHIVIEAFRSDELIARPGKGKGNQRELIWQRTSVGGPQPFRVTSTFRCLLHLRRPTHDMEKLTRELDAAPEDGTLLQAAPRIQRDDPEIQKLARQLAEQAGSDNPSDLVRALYDYVSNMVDNEPFLGGKTARDCLRDGSGDSSGKSRLLAALCRNRGIATRVLNGLILTTEQEPKLHYWVEAWVDKHWLPLCPTHHHYDAQKWPKNYLILQLNEEPLFRGRSPVQYGFVVQDLRQPGPAEDEDPAVHRSRALWQRLSLHGLGLKDQHLVRFLLLLPLAALIVSVYRTVIGVPTFGTFSPALLGLAFLDVKALPYGLPIFVLLVLAGWGMRHLLDRFHLLQVPRASALLTLIVLLLLVLILLANQLGIAATHYISLFPLVILTHLVERFWTIEAEDGSLSSFKTLLGTTIVSVSVSLSLGPAVVSWWMFRYPETLGVVLASCFLLGRYTGYRLSELYRFGDLLRLTADKKESPTTTPSSPQKQTTEVREGVAS